MMFSSNVAVLSPLVRHLSSSPNLDSNMLAGFRSFLPWEYVFGFTCLSFEGDYYF